MSVFLDALRAVRARICAWLSRSASQIPPYPLDWSEMAPSEWPDWYKQQQDGLGG